MCGVAGFIDYRGLSNVTDLQKMQAAVHHRGPDDNGMEIYNCQTAKIGLAHTRLSIIDLSVGGRQPMKYLGYTIVFNGEVYNYKHLRSELIKKGHRFLSEADTEVVLHAFAEWGTKCVDSFIGMFAFVIWDNSMQTLYLCRDRAGVKPLYYYVSQDVFLFGSELKAIMGHPMFVKELDKDSVFQYFQFSYVPGPNSIFIDTYKQAPGSWMIVDISTRNIRTETYWRLQDYYEKPEYKLSYNDAIEELFEILKSACLYRTVSDVPIGIFLSGGYDSSLVTSILQSSNNQQMKTFTIGFPDGVDETQNAIKVASILETDHTSYACSYHDAMDIIPALPVCYDEPFADISAIPSILVSRLARDSVKVALSADGGDEMFAGYSMYNWFIKRLEHINMVRLDSKYIPQVIVQMVLSIIPNGYYHMKHRIRGLHKLIAGERLNMVRDLMYYSRILSEDFNSALFSCQMDEKRPFTFTRDYEGISDARQSMLLIDYIQNLSDCLLVKVDRATMFASLEGREPLIDHRIAEYTARLPFEFKNNAGSSKRILKDLTHKYLPSSIMNRPKVGFDLPIYKWLKTDLSYLIENYLEPKGIGASGLFNEQYVTKVVKDFRSDRLLYKPILWRLLTFQMWYSHWIDKK